MGLDHSGRRTAEFVRNFLASRPQEHRKIIKQTDKATADTVFSGKETDVQSLQTTVRNLYSQENYTTALSEEIEFYTNRIKFIERDIATLEKKKKERGDAADSALVYLRSKCGDSALTQVNAICLREPDGMDAVRAFLSYAKLHWGGDPGQVRQQINGALDNLPIGKTKSDLAKLVTDTDRILLEMEEHAKDNGGAVFSRAIEQPWSDAKVILHFREHISSDKNCEVKPIADYMNKRRKEDERLTLKDLREEITHECRATMKTRDEIMRENSTHLTLSAASARDMATMQSEVERLQEANSTLESHLMVGFRANAAFGQNGIGMTGLGAPGVGYQQSVCSWWDGQTCRFPHGPCLKQASHTPGVNHRQAFFKAAEERDQAKRQRRY